MDRAFYERLTVQAAELRAAGLYKSERELKSPQSAHIRVASGETVVNLCANNYLGLANHPYVVAAAHAALDADGYGMASVRFICGTQAVHRKLERRSAAFLGTEDAILYSSCFDANGGLFETLLDDEDAVISDALNHASHHRRHPPVQGPALPLCATTTWPTWKRGSRGRGRRRFKLIVTDGVFSMDGTIANLRGDLRPRRPLWRAGRWSTTATPSASSAADGRGTPEHCGVLGRVDILTGTLGKALGGASGGYVAAARAVVDWLRQRSRPYLFSNTSRRRSSRPLAQGAGHAHARDSLRAQAARDNAPTSAPGSPMLGFTLQARQAPDHSGDDRRRHAGAAGMANRLLELGIYVVGFSYPGGPAGPGAHPHPDVGGPFARGPRPGRGGVYQGGRELGVI